MAMNIKESLGLRGRLEIVAISRRTGEVLYNEKQDNIVLYQGNAQVVTTLFSTSPATAPRVVTRMAIGDQGAIPSDSQVAKIPTPDLTSLYHEIYRKDVDSSTQVLLGTTIFPGDTNNCTLVSTFNASDVPLSAYSNPSTPVVNEVGLVIINPAAPSGLSRTPVIAPAAAASDEVLLSIRCFKSIPFLVADDVSVTIRYTISLS